MTTRKTVTFGIDDIELLYSIPRPGGDLARIIRTFVFVNRSAPPSFSLLNDCLSKAMQAGILVECDGQYRIDPIWYDKIHSHDNLDVNEIQSMLAFQDEFAGKEVLAVVTTPARFTEKDYQLAVKSLDP